MRQFHFISGLPRSGSTLLANLLGQNPQVHVTPTSACHDVLFSVRNNWSNWIEHKASPQLGSIKNLRNVLQFILSSYHNTSAPIVIDKGRGWLSLLEMTEWILERPAKVLVPVRNATCILSSMEKVWRKTSTHRQEPVEHENYIAMQTTAGRCEVWSKSDQVFGLAYNRLKDAIQRGFRDRLHFVEFDDLTQRPAETVAGIYKFLDLPPWEHDFNNVAQLTEEDDTVHSMPGLHTIQPVITPKADDSISVLGGEVCHKYARAEFWRTV